MLSELGLSGEKVNVYSLWKVKMGSALIRMAHAVLAIMYLTCSSGVNSLGIFIIYE